ncbi:phage protein GemA/Gp16 family protein [Vallitalea guaymasensis]|uniref:phage protein GemA/Gp16 family protein n=1 Tax=Vallitalea guaymasensis TaxID=1185412 RepID=UPI00187D5183|nr:phage protein GemA/Gp16 family protein [Vallitalea guaymasensis]
MAKMTQSQRKMIFGLSKKYGLDKNTLYNLIYRIAKKEHISELTKREAIQVIDNLTDKPKQEGMATYNQMKYIKDLAVQANINSLRNFIEKRFSITCPVNDIFRFVTKRKASSIIEALKNMVTEVESKS